MGIDEMFGLRDRVALVTGAGAGIGLAIASALAGAGAHVALADIDAQRAERAARTIVGPGIAVQALCADVSDEDAVRDMVEQVMRRHGRLDVLVNNAGIYPMSPISDLTVGDWDRVVAINLRGPFVCIREATRAMREAGHGGAIINVSSIESMHPSFVGMAHYGASKGGLNMLTRSAALEYAPHGIRVNAVCPGGVATEGTRAALEEGMRELLVPRIPLGRVADPEDVAGAVVFLAGPAARYITGTTLVVDGGYLIS